jgi:hypothetical protein
MEKKECNRELSNHFCYCLRLSYRYTHVLNSPLIESPTYTLRTPSFGYRYQYRDQALLRGLSIHYLRHQGPELIRIQGGGGGGGGGKKKKEKKF